MADAVLSIALETVRDLLMEEARFLRGVRGEVEGIQVELKRMRVFLRNADAKKDKDETLADRVAEIRDLAEDVKDVLDTFVIEVESRRSSGGVKNDLKRYACIWSECIAIHKVGSEIQNINTRLNNFTERLKTYDIPQGESSDSTHENERLDRLTFPHAEEEFVARDEDIGKLVFHLVSEEHFPQVVSIWGMGGLGKTSLAREVYNHPKVQQCFHGFAWVCVTEQCQATKILQDILRQLNAQNKEKSADLTYEQLVTKVYEVQREKKCLVVIDDIWSIDDWNRLRNAFPIGQQHKGSKVLLTTRQQEVALKAHPTGLSHELKLLGEEDGWNLLQKKAFRRRDIGPEYTIDPRMEQLGKEMIRQCKGLPLAVVVLGGILVTRHTSEEWEVVLEDIKSYLARGEGVSGKNGGGVSRVLELSYSNLPYHLKPCFLFLANFEEDSDIKVSKLYRLWLAERIVSSDYQRKGQTMMDVAEDYLVELAQRCMVQVHAKTKNAARRRLTSCRLHDLMRELCLSKVKEENFLKLIGSGAAKEECSTITKTRRLAIHSDEDVGEYEMYVEKQRASHVRSLLIFEGGAGFWLKIKDNLNCFKLLSVLDLEDVDIEGLELPKAIGKITHLRYLSIRDTDIKKLPSSIGKLGYLETLDLRTSYANELFIPNVLWKLKRLRHLYLPPIIKLLEFRLYRKWGKKEKLRLDGLNNLETLVNFHSRTCDAKDLVKLNNLRKLNAIVQTNRQYLAHLVTATNSVLLRQFSLSISDYSFHSEDELNVLRKLLGYHHLNNFYLKGGISKLPEHCDFSPNLTKLRLWDTKLEDDDPMPTLGKLPSLVHLSFREDVFMGKEVVCSSTDFLQLTSLVIRGGLPNLENWTVDQGAFPKLSYCWIEHCPKLKMIPDGFAFLTALKDLTIDGISNELKYRVVKGVDGKEGEDYHKLQHIPSIYIDGKQLIGKLSSPSPPPAFWFLHFTLPGRPPSRGLVSEKSMC